MPYKQQKPVAKHEPEEYPRKSVQCEDGETGEERGRKYATLITSPELAAYRIIHGAEQNSGIDNHLDVPTLMEVLRGQAEAVHRGDLVQAEAMLMNQATALQGLFARLTEKAFSTAALPHFEAFMRMALRAQNQCRATLESLAAVKNPPTIYARQTNIAHGNQLVNNGTCMPPTQAKENEIQQNELLTGSQHGTPVDPRAAGAAIGNDMELETLGESNRAADTTG